MKHASVPSGPTMVSLSSPSSIPLTTKFPDEATSSFMGNTLQNVHFNHYVTAVQPFPTKRMPKHLFSKREMCLFTQFHCTYPLPKKRNTFAQWPNSIGTITVVHVQACLLSPGTIEEIVWAWITSFLFSLSLSGSFSQDQQDCISPKRIDNAEKTFQAQTTKPDTNECASSTLTQENRSNWEGTISH